MTEVAGGAPATDRFDRILVAVGRRPNGRLISAENAGILMIQRGCIAADQQMRTNAPHIFAISDVGQPMLAQKRCGPRSPPAGAAIRRGSHSLGRP